MKKNAVNQLKRTFVPLQRFEEVVTRGIYSAGLKILVLNEDSFTLSSRIVEATGDLENLWASTPAKIGTNEVQNNSEIKSNFKHNKGMQIIPQVLPSEAYKSTSIRGVVKPLRVFDRVVYKQPALNEDEFVKFLSETKEMLSTIGEIHAFDKLKAKHSLWNVEDIAQKSGMEFIETLKFPYGGLKKNNPYCLHTYRVKTKDSS